MEGIKRFRQRQVLTEADTLRSKLGAWAAKTRPVLEDASPQLPEQLTDRQQDVAEPLLAIAEAIGGEWRQLAWQALVELFNGQAAQDQSHGALLLSDIWQVFEDRGVDRLSSADLCCALAKIETSPWGESPHGLPITPTSLARQLAPYELKPTTIRIGNTTPKGYLRRGFEDVWARYLRLSSHKPDIQSATNATKLIQKALEPRQDATAHLPVSLASDLNSQQTNAVAVVSLASCTRGVEGKVQLEGEL